MRTLNPSSEQLAEHRWARRVGKAGLNQVQAGCAVVHQSTATGACGQEHELRAQAVGKRLRDFLDPALGQCRSQFLDNGANFCRRKRHYLYARPSAEGISLLSHPVQSVGTRVIHNHSSRFYPFCPMRPIRTQNKAMRSLRERTASLSQAAPVKETGPRSPWHSVCLLSGDGW